MAGPLPVSDYPAVSCLALFGGEMKKDQMKQKNQWELYFEALKAQDWGKAVRVLEELSKTDRQNPQVHLKLGDTYQRAGDSSNAVAAYHRAASMLTDQGFYQKALALYKIILRLAPYDMDAMDRSREIMTAADGKSGGQPFASAVKAEAPEEDSGPYIAPSPEPTPEQMFGEFKLPPEAATEAEEPLQPGSGIEQELGFGNGPAAEPEMPRSVELPSEWLQSTSYEGDKQAAESESPVLSGFRAAEVPSLFADLPMDDLARVTDELIVRSYDDGEKVVEEGDMGDSLFIIKAGQASVRAHILGRDIELALLGAGDVFGEVSFLTGRPRTADVIARGGLEVYEVTRDTIEDVIGKSPSVLARLQEFFESRVKDTIRKVK